MSSGSGRSAWIGAGVAVVLILGFTNLSGERNTTSRITAEEVSLLRERVADLEAKLGAKLVSSSSAPTVVSSSTGRTLSKASSSGSIMQRPAAASAAAAVPPAAGASAAPAAAATPAAASAAAPMAAAQAQAQAAPIEEAGALVVAALPERTAPTVPKGVVPMGSWWSDKEVQTANQEWCRKPPPYAAPKLTLPRVPEGTDKPLLTTELAKKHASADNMLIATYVNYNRLDFAFTFVKHLIALRECYGSRTCAPALSLSSQWLQLPPLCSYRRYAATAAVPRYCAAC